MKSLLTLLLVIFLTSNLLGVPLPTIEEKEIEGTVVSFTWMSEMQYIERGDNILEHSSEYFARYFIILKTPNLAKKSREAITDHVRRDIISPRMLNIDLKDDEMLLLVSSERLKELQVGVQLTLKDYELSGDEWGIGSNHEEILINNQVPTVIRPPYPRKDAVESEDEGHL